MKREIKKYKLLIELPFAKRGSIWWIKNEDSYELKYPEYRHGDVVYKKGTEIVLFIGNRKGIVKPICQYAGYVSAQGFPEWDTLEGLFFERYRNDKKIFIEIIIKEINI